MTTPIEIVVTGGPGSGKTTGMAHLVDHLTDRGWRVLVVPEVASLVIGGGVGDIDHLAATDRGAYLAVQRRIVEMQTGLANDFRRLARDFARDKQRVVILHDRGVCDNAAYMDAEEFAGVLDQALGRTPAQVAADYDAVVLYDSRRGAAAWACHRHLVRVPFDGAAEVTARLVDELLESTDPQPLEGTSDVQ